MNQKDAEEYLKKFRRQWNIIIGLIAVAVGLSIGLALALLAVFGPK